MKDVRHNGNSKPTCIRLVHVVQLQNVVAVAVADESVAAKGYERLAYIIMSQLITLRESMGSQYS